MSCVIMNCTLRWQVWSTYLQAMPLSTEGEDEHSITQHEALLVAEAKKPRPKLDIMKATMTRSIKPRAEKVPEMTTAEVMNECPYLSIPQLVKNYLVLSFDNHVWIHLKKWIHVIFVKTVVPKTYWTDFLQAKYPCIISVAAWDQNAVW